MNLSEKRYEKILQTIIAEYIATGEPVGSRTISKKSDIGLSAASIRNVMSDLTDSGYIMQPHVSAGRVPTDLGYRFYVDNTVGPGQLNVKEQAAIESLFCGSRFEGSASPVFLDSRRPFQTGRGRGGRRCRGTDVQNN